MPDSSLLSPSPKLVKAMARPNLRGAETVDFADRMKALAGAAVVSKAAEEIGKRAVPAISEGLQVVCSRRKKVMKIISSPKSGSTVSEYLNQLDNELGTHKILTNNECDPTTTATSTTQQTDDREP